MRFLARSMASDTAGGSRFMSVPGQQQKLSSHTLVVGIPGYNVEGTIGSLVRRVRAWPQVHAVIVVDDGSRDDTAGAARAAGAVVVRHRTNLGAGAATRSCFEAARRNGATILVTLDGDGQHNPDEMLDLLAPIVQERADIVIGSRFLKRHNEVPLYRSFGIRLITFLCNFGYKTRITDAQSCFRAYGRRALQGLAIRDAGFGFSVETLIEARLDGLSIAEVPVSCIYNSASHTLSPVIHGTTVALAVLKHRATRPSSRPIYGQVDGDSILSPISSQRTIPSTRPSEASPVGAPPSHR
jgi:glycosyltransferase involved in cell wall biosynthesis